MAKAHSKPRMIAPHFRAKGVRLPSGTGAHAICKGKIPKALTSTELPNANGAHVEAYFQGRYFTWSGNRIGTEDQIKDCQIGIDKLLAHLPAKEPSASDVEPQDHDRPISKRTALKRYQADLDKFRDMKLPTDPQNEMLNKCSFFAARAFAAGVFDDKTKEQVQEELRQVAESSGYCPGITDTLNSGWSNGIKQPLVIREEILYGPRLLKEAVVASEKVLCSLPSTKYYESDRRLVVPCYAREVDEIEGVKRDDSSIIIADASPATIRRDLDTHTAFVSPHTSAKNKVTYRPILPPAEIPIQLLDRVKKETGDTPYPHLDIVVNTPVLLPSGEIHHDFGELRQGVLLQRGIDEYFPKEAWTPEVIENPRKGGALFMLRRFDYVFKNFPFKTSTEGQDWHKTPSYSVVLAGVLTLAARPMLLSAAVPLFASSSPKWRSGKTHLINSIVIAALGHEPTTVTYTEETEFGKALVPILLQQDRAVLIDNVPRGRTLTSDKLSMLITGNRLRDRILGKSEMIDLRNRSVFFATGNNLTIGSDLASRALLIRIDPNIEHPEERSFNFNPTERARVMHPWLLKAALIALRAYITAGSPWGLKRAPLGGFERWDKLVSGCLTWLGYADPVETRSEVLSDDPESSANHDLLQAWYAEFGSRAIKIAQIEARPTSELYRLLLDHGSWNIRHVGWLLRGLRDRVEGNLKLIKATGLGGSDRGYWKVIKADAEGQDSEVEPRDSGLPF